MKYDQTKLVTLFYSALIKVSLQRSGGLEGILQNPDRKREKLILLERSKKTSKPMSKPRNNYRLPKFTPQIY